MRKRLKGAYFAKQLVGCKGAGTHLVTLACDPLFWRFAPFSISVAVGASC